MLKSISDSSLAGIDQELERLRIELERIDIVITVLEPLASTRRRGRPPGRTRRLPQCSASDLSGKGDGSRELVRAGTHTDPKPIE
jgi:hypothetical protein